MICIHYNNGRMLEGIVLAFGDRLVRVAVKGSDDCVEFRLVNRVWVSEDCEIVRLEFADAVAQAVSEETDLMEALLRFERQPAAIQRVM